MKITKHSLGHLPFCYATNHVYENGNLKFLFAPDAPGPCYSFDAKTHEKEVIWEKPGGTMSLIPVPGREGVILAVHRFNPGFQAQDAEIVELTKKNRAWKKRILYKLPYVHRIDVLERGGVQYIIACTISTTKKSVEDWSDPGCIYVAELSGEVVVPPLAKIAGGMNRNHGYLHLGAPGNSSALTSCDQGIFTVVPPPSRVGEWTIEKIFDKPTSDIALCDIDGDGEEELATIEPFHGTTYAIYRKTRGNYAPIYTTPDPLDFCHVIWGGEIRGEKAFLCGCREGDKALFFIHFRDGKFMTKTIEEGLGPSNAHVVHTRDVDYLLVANRGNGECAVFEIRDGE